MLPQLIPVLHDRATVAAVGLSYEVNPAMQIVARRKENWYNSIERVGADGFLWGYQHFLIADIFLPTGKISVFGLVENAYKCVENIDHSSRINSRLFRVFAWMLFVLW